MSTLSGAGELRSSRMWARVAACAACGWAFLFAALSFFWAAGGRTGLHPLEQAGAANAGLWIAANVVAGVLKVVGALLALALVYTWTPPALRKPLRALIWLAGIGMCLYGGLGVLSDVLHVIGVVNYPATRHWFFVYLALWDPWWILGGVLYVAAVWLTRPRNERVGGQATPEITEQPRGA